MFQHPFSEWIFRQPFSEWMFMHPSARFMSANMSRIAAGPKGGVARKNSSIETGNLYVTRCVSCVSFYCCAPETLSVGARKDFCDLNQPRRSYLQGNTDKIVLKELDVPLEWMLQHPASEWMLQQACERSWRGFWTLEQREKVPGVVAASCGVVVESSGRREAVWS
jgi:hypothetical protein